VCVCGRLDSEGADRRVGGPAGRERERDPQCTHTEHSCNGRVLLLRSHAAILRLRTVLQAAATICGMYVYVRPVVDKSTVGFRS